jgi:hypothetical protein
MVSFPLGLSGVEQKGRLVVASNLNIVLHARKGEVLGGAAYSLPERFVVAQKGEIVSFFVPVRYSPVK